MGKNPAFQFYVRDWLSDPQLKMVSFQTKGIWMDFLCYLWESPDRGILTSTPEKFCQMLGCSYDEWERFIEEASVTEFADVTNCNGIVTVKNRRMFREDKERKNTKLRVERFRQKRESNAPCNANITVPSSSSSSSSTSNTKESPPTPPGAKTTFEPNCTEEQRHKIETLALELSSSWRKVLLLKNEVISWAHPDSIIMALEWIKTHPEIKDKYQYAMKMIKDQSQNLRSKDFYQKDQPNKNLFEGLLTDIKKFNQTIEKG